MNTCRFCKGDDFEGSKYKLIKYAVRHYAHPDCALRKLGAKFFDRLTAYQLERFPALAANSVGLLKELIVRIEAVGGKQMNLPNKGSRI